MKWSSKKLKLTKSAPSPLIIDTITHTQLHMKVENIEDFKLFYLIFLDFYVFIFIFLNLIESGVVGLEHFMKNIKFMNINYI